MSIKIVMLLLIFFTISNAAIITVDNKTPSLGDYTTIQAAYDAASNGDTILVYPSNIPYGGINVYKQIHLIGTGIVAPTENIKQTICNGIFNFFTGSVGSSIEGFQFASALSIFIYANNITVKRNKLTRIEIGSEKQGIIIIQNYLEPVVPSNGAINSSHPCEAFISNNVFYTTISSVGIKSLSGNSSLQIHHNIFYNSDPNTFAFIVKINSYIVNNIIINGQIDYNGSMDVYNNMCNSTQLPSGNGNLLNVVMNTVFEDYLNGNYHLKAGSPAIGSGKNGVDMGIYGGPMPFIDGGYPALPSIIGLDASTIVTQQQGLNVTVQAKSNRE